MKIILLQMGKTNEKYVAEGVEMYSSRMRKSSGFEIITVPDLKNTRNMVGQVLKEKDGKKILGFLHEGDYIILLDEHGKEFRTTEFAYWLENRIMQPDKRILFIIGGAWGLSEEIQLKADMKISLSKMTFPHQLVRLIFVEQLYRALSIIKGSPYHHE